MKSNKGFTLIELLVVIAIIGILAGIIITNLGTARNKGKNASAISSMSSMRSAAEAATDASGNYPSDLCTADLDDLVNAAQTQTGDVIECNVNAGRTQWAAEIALLESAGNYCVDSTGYAGTSTTALAETATVCAR